MAHDGLIVRVFNDIIWVYEFQPDGLTALGSKRFIQRPQGHGLFLREKAEFMHYPVMKKMRMWYTFFCDHTFCEKEYRISKKQCAEYIGAPLAFMYLSEFIHKSRHLVKK